MTDEIKIEKNVPMPSRTSVSRKWDFLKDIAVGDSFLVDLNDRGTVYAYGRRLNFKIATRIDANKVRVWRIA